MSIVTEFFDRLPNSDGELRRRFTSGLLSLLIVGAGVFWMPGIPNLANDIGNGIRIINIDISSFDSLIFGVILISVVFIAGTAIEVVSDVFVRRIFSLLVRRFVTITLYDNDQFPEPVKRGLQNPFSSKFDVAFRYLIHISPGDEKMWLQGMFSRNRNAFSVLSSTLLAVSVVVVLFIAMDRSAAPNNLGSNDAKQCFRNLIISMQDKELFPEEEAYLLLTDINKEIYDAVEHIQNTLRFHRRELERSEMVGEDEVNFSSVDRFDRNFLDCNAIIDPTTIDSNLIRTSVSIRTVVTSSIGILLFVIVLAFAYAWMVRDSIDNALDVVRLRRTVKGKTRGEQRVIGSVSVTKGKRKSRERKTAD